jgi:hypothetical protein
MKTDVTKNGMVFTCTREDQLNSFLEDGWKKKAAKADKAKEDKSEGDNPKGEKAAGGENK